jgi:hypothetical protein
LLLLFLVSVGVFIITASPRIRFSSGLGSTDGGQKPSPSARRISFSGHASVSVDGAGQWAKQRPLYVFIFVVIRTIS